MALKAGNIKSVDYKDSMAQAMEIAFNNTWPLVMNSDAPQVSKETKLLFIAISQGIVQHLKDNANAFKITVNFSLNHNHTAELTIST